MQKTVDALKEGFEESELGGYVHKFGDGYELWFEPQLFDGQMLVALYKDGDLVTNKVVVKPGK